MTLYNDSYLMHYGVLGMKWGVHRANRYAKKAAKSRAEAKRLKGYGTTAMTNWANKETAKADKYAAKSKAIRNKHKQLAGGSKAYNYMNKQSIGKTVVKASLLTSYGALKYDQARSAGKTRVSALLEGIGYATINNLTLGVASVVEPRMN